MFRPSVVSRAAGSLCLPVLLCLGCRSTDDHQSRVAREAEFMRPFDEYNAQKAAAWEAGFETQDFEFEGHGKVTVTRWELVGWPGEEYVKAQIRYENTTDTPMTQAIVWLEVLDSEGRVAGSSAVRLFNPFGFAIWPNGMFSSEVQTRTNGAHLDPNGWQWGIACTAAVDDDPGEPPVLVVTREMIDAGLAPGNTLPPYTKPSARRPSPSVRTGHDSPHVPGRSPW